MHYVPGIFPALLLCDPTSMCKKVIFQDLTPIPTRIKVLVQGETGLLDSSVSPPFQLVVGRLR